MWYLYLKFFLAEEAKTVATSEVVDKEQIKTQSNGDTGEFYIEVVILRNNILKHIII